MSVDKSRKINIVDVTMRDGSHAMSHALSPEQVKTITRELDAAGAALIEVAHGDGISGSTYNYGFMKYDEDLLIRTMCENTKNAKPCVLLIPGVGTVSDLRRVQKYGVKAVRVATMCTEADIGAQHIAAAKELDMLAVGFLMMVHLLSPKELAEQAKKAESYGADYINLADSCGYLLPDGVKERIEAIRDAVSIPVGFHAHNNLGTAVANSLAAVQAGAEYIDVALRGLGAGAGNTQHEVLAGVLQREGWNTGLDFYRISDLAENIVEPIMPRPQVIGTSQLMLGYAGVYSSFLLHVYRSAEKFGLEPRDILVELGRRKMVAGQEDMIIDVAYSMSKEK